MFYWNLAKQEVPESEQFCIDSLPIYIFFYKSSSLALTLLDSM